MSVSSNKQAAVTDNKSGSRASDEEVKTAVKVGELSIPSRTLEEEILLSYSLDQPCESARP